jgi:ATP-dependent protease HslVU (ClpYQ) peptidase subunit
MSVVVARVTDKYIFMSADSGCYCGGNIIPTKNMNISKMEKINGMILGGVGLAEENQLFFDYMKTHILDAVDPEHIRIFVKEFLAYKAELGLPNKLENEYLLAAKGKCYNVQGMFVAEVMSSWAIGAGANYANGALYMGATASVAVEAAITLCVFVDGKIHSESIER